MTLTLTPAMPVRELSAGASLAMALGFGAVGVTMTAVTDQSAAFFAHTSVGRQYDSEGLDSKSAAWASDSGVVITQAGVRDRQEREFSPRLTPADQINRIRALSGLTNDQIGRLFGVSRRSIHNWLSGQSMSPRHEERAIRIIDVLQGLPGVDPVDRRGALLDSSRGKSLFHQLVAQPHEKIHSSDLSVTERLGL